MIATLMIWSQYESTGNICAMTWKLGIAGTTVWYRIQTSGLNRKRDRAKNAEIL
jgi:hypothetical protein